MNCLLSEERGQTIIHAHSFDQNISKIENVLYQLWRASPRQCRCLQCCGWPGRDSCCLQRDWQSRYHKAQSRPRKRWPAESASPTQPCRCCSAAGWKVTSSPQPPCTRAGTVSETHSERHNNIWCWRNTKKVLTDRSVFEPLRTMNLLVKWDQILCYAKAFFVM